MSDLNELVALRHEAEWLQFQKRDDATAWLRAWRQRDRWDNRWAQQWNLFLTKQRKGIDLERLIKIAQKEYGRSVKKATSPTPPPTGGPPPEAVAAVLAAMTAQVSIEQFTNVGLGAYLGLAQQLSEDAGQFTLDALGIGKTFAWASIRDFPDNLLAVRGSKVIQQHYGNHLEKLARMVVAKCNPAAPKTIGQLIREIQQEWSSITRKDAERVARTEAANVWETTNYNALQLNGVTRVDWLIARGPSIGTKVGPVCKICVRMGAMNPHVIDELEMVPPAHPNCRCTIIPTHDAIWLPPAEPWTGGETKLKTFPL